MKCQKRKCQKTKQKEKHFENKSTTMTIIDVSTKTNT